MVGEIGGNDYNYAIFQGKSIEELKSMVPDIVSTIMEGVKVILKRKQQWMCYSQHPFFKHLQNY